MPRNRVTFRKSCSDRTTTTLRPIAMTTSTPAAAPSERRGRKSPNHSGSIAIYLKNSRMTVAPAESSILRWGFSLTLLDASRVIWVTSSERKAGATSEVGPTGRAGVPPVAAGSERMGGVADSLAVRPRM